ncbi:MAG TPA: hypothetical protein VJH95_05070 [Candidatus Nanoarchaeia archaeon]|nr:hypothetical protein [Candidatus Nanoarchaeia archaeon]
MSEKPITYIASYREILRNSTLKVGELGELGVLNEGSERDVVISRWGIVSGSPPYNPWKMNPFEGFPWDNYGEWEAWEAVNQTKPSVWRDLHEYGPRVDEAYIYLGKKPSIELGSLIIDSLKRKNPSSSITLISCQCNVREKEDWLREKERDLPTKILWAPLGFCDFATSALEVIAERRYNQEGMQLTPVKALGSIYCRTLREYPK